MPQMGISVSEGTILEWRKAVGDQVAADEPICDVTTDKVDVEIPCPAAGVLAKILAEPGDTVAVGTVIAEVDVGSANGSAAGHVEAEASGDRSGFVSPVVRRMAEEHGVDLSQVEGHGVGGRIRKKDLVAHIESAPSEKPSRPLHIESPYVPETAPANGAVGNGHAPATPGGRREEMSPMRKTIAEHMVRSRQTAAHATTIVEVDFSAVAARRAELKEAYGRRGVPLTYLAFVARAVVEALEEFPILNASVEGDEIVFHDDVNLGIAVSLDDGLIVPVIAQAQRLALEGLAAAIGDVADARPRAQAHAGRGSGRHVHDHQSRAVRSGARDPDHQPTAGGDPRPRGDRQAAGRGGDRRAGRHRHPADGIPAPFLGPPGPRRRRRGAVPGLGQEQARERGAAMRAIAAPAPSRVPAGLDHEELAVTRGERSGVTMAIAVHSTRLGPALGGARLWHYERDEDGIADALRLAEAMTFKAAAAGLDLGGGKGVICAPDSAPPQGELRRAILHDFGDLVESLDGRYITAEDVGTATEDMVEIASRTTHVTGMPVSSGGAGDPSPFTAAGVQAAMRAACERVFGTRDFARRSVAVVGLGHVGERLARGLHGAGAELALADIDPAKRALAEELGAEWLDPEAAIVAARDVIAPCAVGGAIHAGNVGALRCRVLCGAANNQLADERLAERLARRGILYAPDFIANAGGLINVYRELHGYDEQRATALVLGIEQVMADVFEHAAEAGTTPLAAARALARRRLDAAPR